MGKKPGIAGFAWQRAFSLLQRLPHRLGKERELKENNSITTALSSGVEDPRAATSVSLIAALKIRSLGILFLAKVLLVLYFCTLQTY